MDTVVKAATPAQIAAAEARQTAPAAHARQIAPAGFEGSKTIPLTVPVEHDGKTYEAINLRRLKGKDFLALQRLEGDEDMGLLTAISDAPREVLEELDADDFVNLTESARDFLPQKLREAIEQISGAGLNTQP